MGSGGLGRGVGVGAGEGNVSPVTSVVYNFISVHCFHLLTFFSAVIFVCILFVQRKLQSDYNPNQLGAKSRSCTQSSRWLSRGPLCTTSARYE